MKSEVDQKPYAHLFGKLDANFLCNPTKLPFLLRSYGPRQPRLPPILGLWLDVCAPRAMEHHCPAQATKIGIPVQHSKDGRRCANIRQDFRLKDGSTEIRRESLQLWRVQDPDGAGRARVEGEGHRDSALLCGTGQSAPLLHYSQWLDSHYWRFSFTGEISILDSAKQLDLISQQRSYEELVNFRYSPYRCSLVLKGIVLALYILPLPIHGLSFREASRLLYESSEPIRH